MEEWHTMQISRHHSLPSKGGIPMKIQALPQSIINPALKVRDDIKSDFVLKALILANDGAGPLTITKLTYGLVALNRLVKEIVYPGDALTERIEDGYQQITKNDPLILKSMLGSSIRWRSEEMSKTRVLQPGQEALLSMSTSLLLPARPSMPWKSASSIGKTASRQMSVSSCR